MAPTDSHHSIEVFSFASQHKKELQHAFEKYLHLLQLRHNISVWHSGSLEDLDHFSSPVPDTRSIALLFLSDSHEASLPVMKHIRALHDAGAIHLFPVLCTPGEITATALEGLTVLPTTGGPISTWYQQETALYEIALDLAYQIAVMQGRVHARSDGLTSSKKAGDLADEEAVLNEATVRQELEEDETYFGPQHPHIARDLEWLATISRQQGQIEPVVTVYKRILCIQETAYGPSHIYVTKALMELATLHQDQRQFAQAEAYYLRLLAIVEGHPGPLNKSGLPDLLIMIGDMYSQQRATTKLLPYYARAVSLLEEEYGPAHSDLVDVLGKMAIAHYSEGQPEQAEEHLRRLIDGYEQVYGPEHLQLVEVLEQVAKVYQTLGQFQQAEALLQRALAIIEHAYSHTDPQVAHVLSALAHLYEAQENLGQAIVLARRALKIWESDTTNPRPIMHGRNHLAGLYWDQGSKEEGARLSRSLSDLMRELPTLDDADLLPVFENLARFSMDLQEYACAQPIYHRILKQLEKKYGQGHFMLVPALNNLAVSYHRQRKDTIAEPFMRRALALSEEWFGADHPSVRRMLINYRDLLLRLNRKSEAKKIDARLKALRKR